MTEAAPATEPRPEPKPPVIKRRTAEVIEIHYQHEYAVFTIDSQPERNYYGLSIESSYGGYSYAWSHPGDSFRDFLARISVDYVLGKMVGRDEVFDGEATSLEIRKDIIKLRRHHECTEDEARAEWPPREFDGDYAFWDWLKETKLFKDNDAHMYYATKPGFRACQFTALYEKFWPILRAELKKPVAA